LSGNIPVQLGNLSMLEALYLSNNQLEGGIPIELMGVTGLRMLYLDHNRLNGTIPTNIGSLTQLTSLYLNNNQLSGSVPDNLGQAAHLEILNFADNGLGGPIPASLINLKSLKDNQSDFRNNSLDFDPSDPALKAFLDQKQIGGEWQSFQNISHSRSVTSGATAEDFAMVSFVIRVADPSAAAVFGDDIGAYDTELHRIGTYDPLLNFGTYREFDQGLEILPGKAYWVFAKTGVTLTIQGNPVSLNQDVLVPLAFNAESGDGWNMVACPNQAVYKWDDLLVVELDETGAPIESTAIPLGSAASGDMIYKQRMWRWNQGEGGYAYYAPQNAPEDSLHSFDFDPYLSVGEGYWVRAMTSNLALWFKKENQYAQKPDDALLAVMREAKSWLARAFDGPRAAVADADESPPAPITGFSSDGSSRVDGSGGGGCFINTVSDE
ncbi:MAG TPA: hypothetical protein VLT88_09425, partial [Desulfosarcina sp.]|nr:hypothetical protein [Desulfosarcina sp.]